MTDLIDRQAALDALEKIDCSDGVGISSLKCDAVDDAVTAIKALPSAQPTDAEIQRMQDIEQAALEKAYECGKQDAQRLIPCKERLPEAYTDVLVWFEYFRYGNYNRLYQMYGIGSYSAEYDSWMINYETGWRKLRVLAWMPLPAAYQEGGKE